MLRTENIYLIRVHRVPFFQFLLFSNRLFPSYTYFLFAVYMTSNPTEVLNRYFTSKNFIFLQFLLRSRTRVFDSFCPSPASPPRRYSRRDCFNGIRIFHFSEGTFSFHSTIRFFFHQKLPLLNKLEFISLFAFSCLVLVNTLR